MRKYNPFQFEGEGAGTGTESAAAVTETGETTPTQSQEGHPEPAKISLKDAFKDHPEWKKEYDEGISTAIKNRFKDYKTLEESNKSYAELIGLMQDAFPDAPKDADANSMREYLQQKSDIWAEAAAAAGMPVDTYQQMKAIERQNAELLGEQRAAVEAQKREEMFRVWDQQIPAVQQKYPNFDLTTELDNPRFVGLLDMGWSMMDAYEGIHHSEIMEGAIQTAAQQAAQQTAAQIKTQQGRPVENGARTKASTPQHLDPSRFTDEQIEEYRRRVMNGEKISFR